MANKIENPITINNGMGDTEYVITDADLISAMRDMQQGDVIWYRDYNKTGDDCVSLYKRISKAKYEDEDCFIIAFMLCDNDHVNAVIINAAAPDNKLRDALKDMSEWTEYHGMMIVDDEIFDSYFKL